MDSRSKTTSLDAPLQAMGFEFDEFSAKRITGRLKVTPSCCQVGEVKLWKINPSTAENRVLIASSKVTLVCNMAVPNHAKDAVEICKKRAKL